MSNQMLAPGLPVGSPERTALFRELRRTFCEDWRTAEEAAEAERKADAGDLYFVTAGSAVKIGRTTDMQSRLRYIQGHNHERVVVAVLLEGEGWRERDYHRRFKAYRLHGEWFKLSPEIRKVIEELRNADT